MIKLGQGNNHKQIILQIDNLMIILNLMTSEKKKKNHQRHFLSIVMIDSLINHYKEIRNSA